MIFLLYFVQSSTSSPAFLPGSQPPSLYSSGCLPRLKFRYSQLSLVHMPADSLHIRTALTHLDIPAQHDALFQATALLPLGKIVLWLPCPARPPDMFSTRNETPGPYPHSAANTKTVLLFPTMFRPSVPAPFFENNIPIACSCYLLSSFLGLHKQNFSILHL